MDVSKWGATAVRSSSELQAIRDRDRRIVGYEVFYRSSETATTATARNTDATLSVLADLSSPRPQGGQSGRYQYFVNVTREIVVGGIALPPPEEVAVLEIPPDVHADDEVLAGAEQLCAAGYGVALDRYTPGQSNDHDVMLSLASHVKLNMEAHDTADLRAAAEHVRRHSEALLVGCRISSPALRRVAEDVGCVLFQGHAEDAGPRRRQRTISGSLGAYVRVLQLLAPDADEVDLRQVSEAITRDADLSLRVLRACNSAAAAPRHEITSIAQAVALLGVRRLRDSVHIAIAQGLAVQSAAQTVGIIEYATLADLVGDQLSAPAGTGFLAGLLLEAAEVLDTSVDKLIDDLPLARRLADDIRERHGPAGRILDIIEAYKRGTVVPAALPVDIRTLHARAQLIAVGLTAPAIAQPVARPGPLGSAPAKSAPILEPPPTAETTRRVAQWNAWARRREQRQFRRASVPLDDLPPLLGIQPERIDTLAARGEIVSHEIDGTAFAPVWQFTVDGEPINGVREIARDFPGDAVSLSEWITQPCPGLSRAVPLALLLQGRSEEVVRHAKGLLQW